MKSVWLVLAECKAGGWIINGVYSTRRAALEYAASIPHAVFLSERRVDEYSSWEAARRGMREQPQVGIVPLTRDELLAEGLDFSSMVAS